MSERRERPRTKKLTRVTDVDPLQLEVDELRREAEDSQCTIVKLSRRVEEVDALRRENDLIKSQFIEVRGHFQDVAAELKTLREREKKRKTGGGDLDSPRSSADSGPKECPSCDQLDFEKSQLEKKNAGLLHTNRLLHNSCHKLENQIRAYQAEFIECLGIPDSELCRSVSSGGLGKNFRAEGRKLKECECNHLHKFLRKTIENLREDYLEKSAKVSDLHKKHEREMINSQQLQSEIQSLQEERKRAIEGFKKHEGQITYLTDEIKVLQNYCSRELQQEMEGRIQTLKADNRELETEIKTVTGEYEVRIAALEKELQIESQRADELLAQGLEEREMIERRFRQIWEEHNATLTVQLSNLKANYESPLKTSHTREQSLQKELTDLQDRYQTSKDAWEEYRKTLFEQLNDWKFRFSQKCEILDEMRQLKTESEIILTKKTKDLAGCQEMLNKGVEERVKLQKKLDAVQSKLKELLTPSRLTEEGMSTALVPVITLNDPALLSPTKTWFTLRDFRNLKDKMITEMVEGKSPASAGPSPRRYGYSHSAFLPVRPATTSLDHLLSREPYETAAMRSAREEASNLFAFTIGKGRESVKKVKSKPATPLTSGKDPKWNIGKKGGLPNRPTSNVSVTLTSSPSVATTSSSASVATTSSSIHSTL